MCRLVVFFLILSSFQLAGQSSFGGYDHKTKWNQINTPLVRVIFPDSLQERAQRVANVIHYMNEKDVGLLGKKRAKVDVILRNQDVISNGYAQIAPLKTEFFMQAPQNTFEESAVDWTDQLAIHEYRHVNQFINAKRGVGYLLYAIFGDYGWGAMIGLSMPAWFIEGDATITETALSSGGRGRIPSFTSRQRAQLDAGVDYSYMKAMNGSYKDFVPNHYNTGYLILSEMRRNSINDDFSEITRRSSSLTGLVYPFRRAVKKVTGTSIKNHYFQARERLKESIPPQSSPSKVLTELKPRNVVQFKNPIIDGDEIYFSYGDRRRIGGIYRYSEDGNHERIVYQGLAMDTYFSKHKELFAWEELQRDLRRGNQNHSNIILYDAEKKEKRIIGRGEAFRSPSFTNDGRSLIYVNGYEGTQSGIMMYNLETNAMLEIIKSRKKQFLYPIASADGRSIYTIVKEGHYYALAKVSVSGGKVVLITEWDDIVFGPIRLSDGHIIFHGNVGVTDQIHALDLSSGVMKQVSFDNIGMYNPSNYSAGHIIAERPHSQGFLLHELETGPGEWKPVSARRATVLPSYLETHHLEPDNILEKVADTEFEVSKYPRNAKMVRTHSWTPTTDGTEYGVTFFSNNILNNVSIEPSYTYNANVQGSFLNVNMNYGRWFPIYQLGYNFGLPRLLEIEEQDRSFMVSQHSLSPGVIVPLNLTSGTYARNISLATSVSQVWTRIAEIDSEDRFDIEGTTLTGLVNLSFRRLRAQQNLFPRWGYVAGFRNRYRINDGNNVLNLTNDVYVPGLFLNHGLKFEFDYTQQNAVGERRVNQVDIFNYAHGFRRLPHESIWSFNTNYALPLAYPDWGFADFIYFKRIKSTLFYNYNSVMFEDQRTELQSTGVDLLFDLVFINTVFSEITVGFRTAYMSGPLPEGRTTPLHFDFIVDIPAF